jgi:hypothetical protein
MGQSGLALQASNYPPPYSVRYKQPSSQPAGAQEHHGVKINLGAQVHDPGTRSLDQAPPK